VVGGRVGEIMSNEDKKRIMRSNTLDMVISLSHAPHGFMYAHLHDQANKSAASPHSPK